MISNKVAKAATFLALAASSAAGVSGQGNLRGKSCKDAVEASLGQPHQKYFPMYANPPFSVLAGYSERNGTQIIEGNFQYKEDDAFIKDSHVKYTNESVSAVVDDVCRRLDAYVKEADKKAINEQFQQQQDEIKNVDTKVSRVEEAAQTGVGLAAVQWLSVGLLVLDGSCNEGKIIKKIVSLIKSAIKTKSEDKIKELEEEIKGDNISINVLEKISNAFECAAEKELDQASSKVVDSSDILCDISQPSQLSIVKKLIDEEIILAYKKKKNSISKLNKLYALKAGAGLCGSNNITASDV